MDLLLHRRREPAAALIGRHQPMITANPDLLVTVAAAGLRFKRDTGNYISQLYYLVVFLNTPFLNFFVLWIHYSWLKSTSKLYATRKILPALPFQLVTSSYIIGQSCETLVMHVLHNFK